jgi:hypothetical protein
VNNGKEIETKALAHVFEGMASMLYAAGEFYEAGQPEEGDKMIVVINETFDKVTSLIKEAGK